MTKFANRLITLLEQDAAPAEAPTPEQQAMADTLDTAKPEDLGASASDTVLQARAQHANEMISLVKDWVTKIDEFTKYLNDPSSSSIQTQLSKAVPDTILDKVRTTETKRIARTAQDLAGLAESLKGYLATAHDPKYRGS